MLMPCPRLVAGQLSRWQKWTAFQNELGSWPVRDPTGHAWTFLAYSGWTLAFIDGQLTLAWHMKSGGDAKGVAVLDGGFQLSQMRK